MAKDSIVSKITLLEDFMGLTLKKSSNTPIRIICHGMIMNGGS